MKRMLMAIMAVAVAVTFSAPSFADETKKPKEEKTEKKDKPKAVQMIYADDHGTKKPEPKDEPKDEMKKPETKK